MTAPVKYSIPEANSTRPLTEAEKAYYTTMADHYRERVLANPCNRGLRSYWKALLEIVESGRIGTFVTGDINSD